MTSASRRRSSSATRRRSASDPPPASSRSATRTRPRSASDPSHGSSTRDITGSTGKDLPVGLTDDTDQSSISRERSFISDDHEPVGKTKRPKPQDTAVKRVKDVNNVYLKGDTSLVETWQAKTSSTFASNRGKNQPILLEIDQLLGEYQTLGQPKPGSNSQPHLDKLDEIQAKLDTLLKNPGSRRAAALELQAFVQTEMATIQSQTNDYIKDDVNLLHTWKQKTALTRTKRAGNLKEIDQLLADYQNLGEPYWGDPKLHRDKLTEINQKLNALLSTSTTTRQTAAVAGELQTFVRMALTALSTLKPPEDDDWSPQKVAEVMTGGVKDTLDEQNKANALVWYHTLFSPGKSGWVGGYNEREEAILKDQQELLQRYFFSIASLGVLGGDQDDPTTYQPLESFVNKDGDRVGLATVASGGGLFNFRSTDGSGDGFRDFLYGVSTAKDYLGAYTRPATHGNSFTDGKTLELNFARHGEAGWTGINIPIGGIGQHLQTAAGTEVVTEYRGQSNDGKKDYQTGSVLFKHYQSGETGNTLMGFEGSAPHADNIHGGSHGVIATIGKKIFRAASGKTLTGQGKRTKWGVKRDEVRVDGEGGRIAMVDQESLKRLETQWGEFQKRSLADQQAFFKELLLTTTQQARTDLFKKYGLTSQTKDSSPQKDTLSFSKSFASSIRDDDSETDIPPPLPILGADGVILDDARVLFRDAYRQDIRNGAYLTEAEGHIAADAMGIKIAVYSDRIPPGFTTVGNPGDGDCLLYSLLQAKEFDKTRQILGSDGNFRGLKSTIEREKYRERIAATITDEEIDPLTDAALAAEVAGVPEIGLGFKMRSLLRSKEVRDFRDSKSKEDQGTVKSQSQPSASESEPESDKPKSDKKPAKPSPQEAPIATYGTGKPLSAKVALFHRGNHYEMIYQP